MLTPTNGAEAGPGRVPRLESHHPSACHPSSMIRRDRTPARHEAPQNPYPRAPLYDLQSNPTGVEKRTVDEQRAPQPSSVGLPVLGNSEVFTDFRPVIGVSCEFLDEPLVGWARRHLKELTRRHEFVPPSDGRQVQIAVANLKRCQTGEVVQPLLHDILGPVQASDHVIADELGQTSSADPSAPLR